MPNRIPPILVLSLNTAVDRTYLIPGFALDRVNRPTETRVTAGGKGVNVARVFQSLGGRATVTGFLGGTHGDMIRRCLRAEGLGSRFVPVHGESRLCTAVIDTASGTLTEINEIGPDVGTDKYDRLQAWLRELLPGCGAVILSGSAPPGGSSRFYAEVIRLAQDEFGVPAVLDASGELLTSGIGARPFLVKPNHQELLALELGVSDWREGARVLRRFSGSPLAMVTAGVHGAVISSVDGDWQAVPPPVRVLSAVGSGDSLTAGFLWSWLRGDAIPQALRMGVAAGTANAMTYSAGFLDCQPVFNLAARIMVTRLA